MLTLQIQKNPRNRSFYISRTLAIFPVRYMYILIDDGKILDKNSIVKYLDHNDLNSSRSDKFNEKKE